MAMAVPCGEAERRSWNLDEVGGLCKEAESPGCCGPSGLMELLREKTAMKSTSGSFALSSFLFENEISRFHCDVSFPDPTQREWSSPALVPY